MAEKDRVLADKGTVNSNTHTLSSHLKPKLSRDRGSFRQNAKLLKAVKKSMEIDDDEVASNISEISPEEQHERQLQLDNAMAEAGLVGDQPESLKEEFEKHGQIAQVADTSGKLAALVEARDAAKTKRLRDAADKEIKAAEAVAIAKAAAEKVQQMELDLKKREAALLAEKAELQRQRDAAAAVAVVATDKNKKPNRQPREEEMPEADEGDDNVSELWSSSRDSTDDDSESQDEDNFGLDNLTSFEACSKELKRLTHELRRTNKTQRSQGAQIAEGRAREMVCCISFLPKDWSPQTLRECMLDMDQSGLLKNTGYPAMNEGGTPIRLWIRNQAVFRQVSNACRSFCDELRIVMDIPDELSIQKRQARDILRSLVLAMQKIRSEDATAPHTQFQVGWPQKKPKNVAAVGDSDWWSISMWTETGDAPKVLLRCEYAHRNRRQVFIVQQQHASHFGLGKNQVKAMIYDMQQYHKFQLKFVRDVELEPLGKRDKPSEATKVTVTTETWREAESAQPYVKPDLKKKQQRQFRPLVEADVKGDSKGKDKEKGKGDWSSQSAKKEWGSGRGGSGRYGGRGRLLPLPWQQW